jgi:acyl-CoA synthetase (AMP-forming)/AMP-acid ligase II
MSGIRDEMSANTVIRLLHPESKSTALLLVNKQSIDHAALALTVERLAGQLRAAGLGAHDRIAIVLGNGIEMALVLLAAMSVGCSAPLNPKYREEEFRFYLDDLGAAAVITIEATVPAAEAAASDGVLRIYVRGSGPSIELDPQGSRKSSDLEVGAPTDDDVAMVLHTSGTTSRPKIVPLRHRNLTASARNIAAHLQLTVADRSLVVMPLFHIHGIMAGMLAPLSAGASVVCAPGFDAFKFHRWLEDVEPTYYSAVPTIHQMVLARGRQSNMLRFVRSSSASLPSSVMSGLQEMFGVPVIEAYGMTEASHQMTSNPLPPGNIKAGSVGVPTGIELGIIDSDNNVLPAGERGEVGVRGASVIEGYENNPTANTAAFTGGWFRTGDEGMMDGDGYLFLTGRIKEQINRGGEKVSPLEVDNAILRHTSVAEAVTFGIPHEKLGEEVGAAVVLRDGHELTEADLRSYLSERLAPFKVPRTIVFVTEIPKGATGKLQRIGLAGKLGLSG